MFLNGEVRHRRGWCSPVPMFLTWRNPEFMRLLFMCGFLARNSGLPTKVGDFVLCRYANYRYLAREADRIFVENDCMILQSFLRGDGESGDGVVGLSGMRADDCGQECSRISFKSARPTFFIRQRRRLTPDRRLGRVACSPQSAL